MKDGSFFKTSQEFKINPEPQRKVRTQRVPADFSLNQNSHQSQSHRSKVKFSHFFPLRLRTAFSFVALTFGCLLHWLYSFKSNCCSDLYCPHEERQHAHTNTIKTVCDKSKKNRTRRIKIKCWAVRGTKRLFIIYQSTYCTWDQWKLQRGAAHVWTPGSLVCFKRQTALKMSFLQVTWWVWLAVRCAGL